MPSSRSRSSCWSLANARFLAARPDLTAGSWSSVVGLATLVVTVVALLPLAVAGHASAPTAGRPGPAVFVAGVVLLGVVVSWGGTWLWNTASARLPTTTAGLLINIETVSGYVYVYLARRHWPPLGQIAGFALILARVILALRARQPGLPDAVSAPAAAPSETVSP